MFAAESICQDIANDWLDSIRNYDDFEEVSISKFTNWDFSNLLSNQESGNWSSYVGVFGSNYRRIDFHMNVSKSDEKYQVVGSSKLGENIQEFKGTLTLEKAFLRVQNYITDSLYIGLFKCELNEPGTKNGDGTFLGIFTLVFYNKNDQVNIFKTSSGDTPSFTNTFVGNWMKYGSEKPRKVVFSFHAAGLYEKLPYCDNFYTIEGYNDDYLIINSEYLKFGWDDYDYDGGKSYWWK